MQSAKRQPAGTRNALLLQTKAAAPVLAILLSFGFCTPSFSATTAWTESVRAHLGLAAAAHDSEAPPAAAGPTAIAATTPAPAAARPATFWARSVEAHLADRALRVAAAGRAALAWSESGVASWYGGRFSGRRTSSGAKYNPIQLTCAHPTLPLGTRVLVTSEDTGRSVVVTVNDRGPFGGRIVDLSREAAARIGILGAGTGSVTLEKATPEIIEVAEAQEKATSEEAIEAADTTARAPAARRHARRGQ